MSISWVWKDTIRQRHYLIIQYMDYFFRSIKVNVCVQGGSFISLGSAHVPVIQDHAGEMTAKVDAGVYLMCIFLFHWILSLRVLGAFPLLTSSRPSQKAIIPLCRHSRVNDNIMEIIVKVLELILPGVIFPVVMSLLAPYVVKLIPSELWGIVVSVGVIIVGLLLYIWILVCDERRRTKKQEAIPACNSTGPLPGSSDTTPPPECNGTALQPLQVPDSRVLQPRQDSNSRAPPYLQNSNGVATPPLQDSNGTKPPTRLVHRESTLGTNPEKEQEHLHPEETKALVPREDTQHSALQENSTSQGTSTGPSEPTDEDVIQEFLDRLTTEGVQKFSGSQEFVAITISDNYCQPARVEAALGSSVTLPAGSKVVYKWFEVGPQTTKDQLHTLKLQIMESVREAQEIDKDFTLQLGSFAVLKYTDHGPKWWRLQEHWIPTISNIRRSPWNLSDLFTGRSATWIIRGFNLQNAQLKFSNVDEKEVLNILRSYKMESGEDVLLCEEPYDLIHNSALLFRKEIYICALRSVEVEEGVVVNLQSNPHRVHNKTYWVSVVQGLIPSQWALLILASLSLHNIVKGGINLQGTSIFAHILGKGLYKFLIYIFSYFILVFVLTFWRLTYGQVQRAADDVPIPRVITSCEGFNNDRRRISLVDLVFKVTSFANQLQDGWYQGSAEVDSFRDQVLMLTQKHDQWSAQLRRHGLSEDKCLLKAVQTTVQVLDEQEKYIRKMQKNRLWRLTRKAFPSQLSNSLTKILEIMDAGPQLLAGRVTTHDLLERSRAQTPAPFPFIADLNYVPITKSILKIRKALEDQEGPHVVTLFGGPGLGKSSVVKYLALHYHEEKSHWLRGTQSQTVSFPDGVFYLFCGKGAQDRVKQLQLELLDCLGFGTSSATPPNDLVATEVQEGGYLQVPSHQMKLRSRLAEQKLLIVLDDLWERDVLQQLLIPAKGVKYLITSQMRDIWGPAVRVQMRNPTLQEARRIMSNYTKGLLIKGKFPEKIQSVTDDIIRKLDYHPLSLADIGSSINSSRASDVSHWKAVSNNIQVVLDDDERLQGSSVVYDQPYNLTVKASMMYMVESLHPEAQRLLFLIALLEGQHLPETLVKYFYKFVQSHQTSDFLWKYNNREKYLEERSLVDLHIQPGGHSMLTVHDLRMRYIREHRTVDVRSIASHILASSDEGGSELIQMGDAESTLVTILSAIYFAKPFKDDVVHTLESHLRILNDGVISRNINNSMDPLDLVKSTAGVGELVSLLNVDHGDHDCKQQAHVYAKKIIIKLACQGRLDDYSMARLLQLPWATSVGCAVLGRIIMRPSDFDENSETFSSTHGETMSTLLTLFQDDATSTKTRLAVADALMLVLNFESKDTIVKVASKFTELLAMDSNPTLQTGLARILKNRNLRRVVIMLGEFTTTLEVLVRLLVFGKDSEVRVSAGEALNRFCGWKCAALKIAAIPGALDNLFDLFLSNESLRKTPIPPETVMRTRFRSGSLYIVRSPSFFAGYILGGLSCVEENRMKFRALKNSLDGLGNMLTRMEGSWRSILEEEKREEEKERASIAAGILGELGLEKELRDHISSLPGVEDGLLFLQKIEMAGLSHMDPVEGWTLEWIYPSNTIRALAILYSKYSNPRSRDVPSVEQVQGMFSSEKCPPAEASFVAGLCQFRVGWTRTLVHIEMGSYKAALENLDATQHHLDQMIVNLDYHEIDYERKIVLQTSNAWVKSDASACSATEVLSSTRIFLQVVLEAHAGELLGANKRVEKAKGAYFGGTLSPLTHRGIVKRVCRDLPGALHDLNTAYHAALSAGERYDILKHRGYVKHLMEDNVGAKEDAEAAQKLKLNRTAVEETIDCRRFWDFRKLPISYLGYLL